MNRAKVQGLIRNAHRRPVRVCMDDGKIYTISDPDFALAGQDSIVLVAGPGHDFGASHVICFEEHISRIELVQKPRAKAGEPSFVAAAVRRRIPWPVVDSASSRRRLRR